MKALLDDSMWTSVVCDVSVFEQHFRLADNVDVAAVASELCDAEGANNFLLSSSAEFEELFSIVSIPLYFEVFPTSTF